MQMIETKVGSFTPESRLLIDGELADAESGRRFDNINRRRGFCARSPTGSRGHGRAITAARRASTKTDWPTIARLRRRCLEQLQEAVEAEREEMRAELVAEPDALMVTYSAQLDAPRGRLRWPAKNLEQFQWERQLADRTPSASAVAF